MKTIDTIIEHFTIIRFTLARLQERERALVLTVVIAGLMLLWYLIAYVPQSKALSQTRATTQSQATALTQLKQKRMVIEGLIKDNSISKLLEKYQRLEAELKELGESLKRYQTRYVDYGQINSLLFSILQQTSDVSIVKFSNTSTVTKDVSTEVIALDAPSGTPPPTADTANKPIAGIADSVKVEHYQYKLVLKGTYAGITNYLTKLEATGGQFYWDKLNYTVKKHPDAEVVVEFYTLRLLGNDLNNSAKGEGA